MFDKFLEKLRSLLCIEYILCHFPQLYLIVKDSYLILKYLNIIH